MSAGICFVRAKRYGQKCAKKGPKTGVFMITTGGYAGQLKADRGEKVGEYTRIFGEAENENGPGRGFYEGHVKIGNFFCRC